MMGTGEASGEGRAMAAAEAAIANPLLDETSMKGAQGLLISITGGRDMTLFEVDEAATRIREEVDQDANIILGATFDESLEGIIRVSVVATGIDRNVSSEDVRPAAPVRPIARPAAAVTSAPVAAFSPAYQQPAAKTVDPVAETIRQAEVAMERELEIATQQAPAAVQQPAVQQDTFRPQSRLFTAPPADVAPVAPRPAPQPVAAAPVAAPAPQPRMEPVAVQPRIEEPRRAEPMMDMAPRMEQSAPMPVAPQPMAAAVAHEPVMERREPDMARMPRIEDFPPVVKAEMEHRTRDVPSHGDERGPMGLLKRLTNSLGRKEDEMPAAPAEMAAPQAAQQQRRGLSAEASLYAPRRGQLDDLGRSAPKPVSSHEDDQLEIPAFLRRQSN
jgi:cell division protein FtsZ